MEMEMEYMEIRLMVDWMQFGDEQDDYDQCLHNQIDLATKQEQILDGWYGSGVVDQTW